MNKLTQNYTIDGKSIYEPHLQMSETVESMLDENSGATDDGVMHVRWTRSAVHKYSLQYNIMTAAEYDYMKDLLLGKTFVFKFPYCAEQKQINAYCTSYGGVLSRVDENGGIYTAVQFEICEL